MTRRILLSVAAIFTLYHAAAQSERPKGVDTTFISGFAEKFLVEVFLAKDIMTLDYEPSGAPELSFISNNPPSLGAGIAIMNTLLNFSYGYGMRFMSDKSKGKTKSFDFQLHHYGRKFMADLFIQRYKGFYLDEPRFELCPDLAVRHYGIHGSYIFNHPKFSYRAVYAHSERQLRSSGTFLAGAGAHITEISSDSSLVIGTRNRFRFFQAGVSGGYAHNWIIRSNWFIDLSCTAGVNIGEGIKGSGDKKIGVFPMLMARAAAGYSGRTWSAGFGFVMHVTVPALDNRASMALNSGGLRLSFVKRFDGRRRSRGGTD